MKILSIIFIFSVGLSAFGQGITCAIPYNPKVIKLTSKNVIIGRGISVAKDPQSYNEISYWNLPVCYDDGFNFFASDKNFKNSFDVTANGDYLFARSEDIKYKAFPMGNFWNSDAKPNGNNKIKMKGIEFQFNERLPIYVIQSKSNYYKNLGLTYNEIISNKTNSWQPLSEYISRKILENNYLTQYKEKVINLSGYIKFTDSVSIESNAANSGNDNLIRNINGHLSEWAKMYQPFSKEDNLPIHCNKGFIISLKKESISERKSFYDLNEKILTNGNKFKGIFESEIKIPRKAVCNIENSKISISIDSETKNEEKVYLKSIFIPRSINLYPTLAFTGMSHYLILKQSHRKKFIPALTIGSAGVFALAWGTKQLFYNRYLEQPNTRTNSYITANTSYHIMKFALLTYAIGVSLDLHKTCQSIKKLTRLVNEVNPKI
jgi:hypothetical protein